MFPKEPKDNSNSENMPQRPTAPIQAGTPQFRPILPPKPKFIPPRPRSQGPSTAQSAMNAQPPPIPPKIAAGGQQTGQNAQLRPSTAQPFSSETPLPPQTGPSTVGQLPQSPVKRVPGTRVGNPPDENLSSYAGGRPRPTVPLRKPTLFTANNTGVANNQHMSSAIRTSALPSASSGQRFVRPNSVQPTQQTEHLKQDIQRTDSARAQTDSTRTDTSTSSKSSSNQVSQNESGTHSNETETHSNEVEICSSAILSQTSAAALASHQEFEQTDIDIPPELLADCESERLDEELSKVVNDLESTLKDSFGEVFRSVKIDGSRLHMKFNKRCRDHIESTIKNALIKLQSQALSPNSEDAVARSADAEKSSTDCPDSQSNSQSQETVNRDEDEYVSRCPRRSAITPPVSPNGQQQTSDSKSTTSNKDDDCYNSRAPRK